MRLATIRDGGRTLAVRADGDDVVELPAADVREVLDRDGWQGLGPRRRTVPGARPAASTSPR
jgi:hypothetical protein